MSSAASIIHNFDNVPLESPDFNLIQNALQYKQAKLDTNRAKIQSISDQFQMLDVAKDVDKDYIDKRLQSVVDTANQYAGGDLSSSSLTNSIIQNIGQVADDNVKNAVFSTKLYRAEQAEWDKIRKDSPEKYSETNHAYASRVSKQWLADQTVGKRYTGGGGFIEYRDLSKKLLDNIGKMQEQLKAKWVQTGPKQGYFQSLDTYEAVDRNKMNQALDALYDEKDQQQMKINAWADYGSTSTEQMKADWNAISAPELETAQNRIAALKVLKAKPEESANIATYDAEIKTHEQTIENIQANNFEDVYDTYGHEGAAQILYKAKLKDSILDAYSYQPRLIDRKIDDVQAESIKFQQKVSEFDQTMELKKADLLLRTEQLKINKQLAEAKLGVDSEGNPTKKDTDKSEPVVLKNPTPKTGIEEHLSVISNSWKGIEALGVERGDIDKNDFVKLNTQLADLEGKVKRGESVNIGGKSIKVTLDNIVKLRNFRDNVVNTSKAEKEIHGHIDNMLYGGKDGGIGIQTTLERLAEAKVKGRAYDFDIAELPKFDWILVADGKGGYVKAKPKTSNPYATLLTMKATGKELSDAQQKTLQAYTAQYAISDDRLSIPDDMRVEMYRNLKYNTLKGVSSSVAASIIGNNLDELKSKIKPKVYGSEVRNSTRFKTPIPYGAVNLNTEKLLNNYDVELRQDHWSKSTFSDPILHNTISKVNEAYNMLDINPKDQRAIQIINQAKNDLANYQKQKDRNVQYTPLSSITAYDTEWNDASGNEKSIGGMNNLVDKTIQSINSLSNMDKIYKEMSYQNPILNPGNPDYKAIKGLAIQKGLVGEDYKGPLEVERFNKDDLSGKDVVIKASIKKSSKEGGGYEYKSSEPIEYNNFLKGTNFEIAKPKRPTYDATRGEYAESITLGTGAGIDDSGSFAENIPNIVAFAKTTNTQKIGDIVNNYFDGKYRFNIEPINNQYFKTVRDTSGNIVYKATTGQVTFDDEDYKHIVGNSDTAVSDIMTEWLEVEKNRAIALQNANALKQQTQQAREYLK
jgi:hypothetical protein